MLTTAEEDRLEADLPLVQSILYAGNSYEYELSPYWFGPDHSGDDADLVAEYPAIVLEWETQGDENEDRRPLGGVSEIDDRGDEAAFVETEVVEYDDELSITVAVEATHDSNGVPPDVRGKQLARAIWRYIVFEMDLDSVGANGERPLLVEPLNPPTPGRVAGTYRLEWSVQVSYVDEHEEVHETVDDAEYAVDME